ncbi:MAG: Asp23/Gls24 family envelope stress response protein [Oscillospiraceae bacterium]|nr:Asp23/Gls24 family envelope stress response protein [Oscillospiraceae bacterium]
MADNKEYFTLPGDKGNINISEDVIATVAANAARDVDGVASLGRDNGEIWGKKPASRGVRVINNGEDVAVELGIMVKRTGAVVLNVMLLSLASVAFTKIPSIGLTEVVVETTISVPASFIL